MKEPGAERRDMVICCIYIIKLITLIKLIIPCTLTLHVLRRRVGNLIVGSKFIYPYVRNLDISGNKLFPRLSGCETGAYENTS